MELYKKEAALSEYEKKSTEDGLKRKLYQMEKKLETLVHEENERVRRKRERDIEQKKELELKQKSDTGLRKDFSQKDIKAY